MTLERSLFIGKTLHPCTLNLFLTEIDIQFGTFINGHVQIWMFLFNILTNTKYSKNHIMLCSILFFLSILLLILLVVLHVQKFEETSKPMLNMESTKECMNILLLTYVMF
jgi:hypothetical protein